MIPERDGFHGKLINDWYLSLNEQERADVLSFTAQGYDELSAYLGEFYPDLAEGMERLQRELHELFREGDEWEIRQRLVANGLYAGDLVNALVAAARNALRMYADAAFLRQASLAEFNRVVSVILKDMFVERRYRSLEKAQQTFQIGDEDKTFKTYMVVRQLLQTFYDQHLAFEELEDFMEMELRFDGKKIQIFCELMREHKAGLDSFFLFRNMTKIMRMLDEL